VIFFLPKRFSNFLYSNSLKVIFLKIVGDALSDCLFRLLSVCLWEIKNSRCFKVIRLFAMAVVHIHALHDAIGVSPRPTDHGGGDGGARVGEQYMTGGQKL
jgi:hypothetical protein